MSCPFLVASRIRHCLHEACFSVTSLLRAGAGGSSRRSTATRTGRPRGARTMPRTLEPIPRAACWGRARPRGKAGTLMGAGRGQLCQRLEAGVAARMGASARTGTNVQDAPPSGGVGEDLCSRGALFSWRGVSSTTVTRPLARQPHDPSLLLAGARNRRRRCRNSSIS